MDDGAPVLLIAFELGLAAASMAAWLRLFERRRRRIPLPAAEPREVVPWNGADVLLLAIAAFFFELAAQSAVAGPTPSDAVSLANVVAVAVSRVAWILFAVVVLSARTGATLHALGFDTRNEARDLRLAGFLFLAAALPVYGTQLVLNFAFGLESDHPLVTLIKSADNTGVLAIVTLAAVVVAPLVEEFLFRVLLQGWLEKWQVSRRHAAEGESPLPGYAPIVVSALFFGLLHVGHGADPVPLFILGLFLGYAYRQTHRIIAPLAIHMLVNSVAMAELWAIYLRGGK